MTRMRAKIFVAVAVVAGFLISSAATFLILNLRASHARSAARLPEPPFKFSRHIGHSGDDSRSVSGNDSGGLVDFTSNIPVIVLRSEWPGPVSRMKTYSPFKMEIHEPKTNAPARLSDAPTVTTRIGVRLHGMVSRLFPKLSYRLKLQDDTGQRRSSSLLGMPADADW